MFDLDFQGHTIKIEFFHYNRWIPWPRKHTHEKYFQKIPTGRQKSRGVVPTPFGRPKVDFYLGHLRVKVFIQRIVSKHIVIVQCLYHIDFNDTKQTLIIVLFKKLFNQRFSYLSTCDQKYIMSHNITLHLLFIVICICTDAWRVTLWYFA